MLYVGSLGWLEIVEVGGNWGYGFAWGYCQVWSLVSGTWEFLGCYWSAYEVITSTVCLAYDI